MFCWKKRDRQQPESPRRAPVPGLAARLTPFGACLARVPGPRLALSYLQGPQPCPSPGRESAALPRHSLPADRRAVAERSGSVTRSGRDGSGEV